MDLKTLRRPKTRKISTQLHWLSFHLAIAGQPGRRDWEAIEAAGIRVVVDLRSQTQDDLQEIRDLGMIHRHEPIVDGETAADAILLELTDWILDQQRQQGPVLIHCREGRGRSAMVACAVLVRMGMPVQDAYRAIRLSRKEFLSLSDVQVEALERFGRMCQRMPRWRQERGA